ncbi:MAG: hypothetical protein V3U75_13570 [Methylococcaceae bacterium]
MSRRRRGFILGNGGSVDWSDYDSTGDKTPVEFSSSAVKYLNVVPIDETRALLIYRGTSGFCRARICSIDGAGLATFGTETVLLSATISDAKADLLDSTHAIVAVESGGDVKMIAIEFSGTSIDTVGTAVTMETVNSGHLSIAAASSSAFFVGYEVSNKGRLGYATVSGTTVTAGNAMQFEALDIVDMNMCSLASGTCLVAAGHTGADDGEVYLVSQSGSTPQVDDQITLVNGTLNVDSIGIARIDDNTAIVSWTETASTTDCSAAIITESGGTLSKGTNEQFSTDVAREQSIALPDVEHAVMTISNSTTEMASIVVEISGASLTALTQYQNVSGDKEYVTNGEVGTDWVLTAYEDDDDLSKGKVLVLGV